MFIVDVACELSKVCNDFVLWWFGNGELEQNIQKYAEEKGIDKYIKFWGADPNVSDYYSAADVFILPSLYEGLPVVGIEAQVAALPTLLSDKITTETKISDAVDFLPISEAKLWAEKIVKLQNRDRNETAKSLDLSAYRIENQADKLKNLYLELLRKTVNKDSLQ